MKLTHEQLDVVHHPLGQHARVLAVAGSGKSTTMAHRFLLVDVGSSLAVSNYHHAAVHLLVVQRIVFRLSGG